MHASDTATRPFTSFEQQADAARLGMWIFLATEILFFGPLFMGYLYGRVHFGDAFAAASRHTDVLLGTLNTGVLLTSSLAMALSVEARRASSARVAGALLVTTAVLGAVFLTIKGIEYWHDWQGHLVPGLRFAFDAPDVAGAAIFFYLYFALTGLHAVHLTIGIALVLWTRALLRGSAANREHIEIVGLYWHFIDIIWIFLYPLLYLVGRAG